MRFVNMTKHPVTIITPTRKLTFPASGSYLRMGTEYIDHGEHEGVPLQSMIYRDPQGLPPPERGTIYIVSMIAFMSIPDRTDLAYPTMTIKDGMGRIIGCRGLIVHPTMAATIGLPAVPNGVPA